jgi:K+ transporter
MSTHSVWKWLWLIYSVQISFGSFVYPSLILAYLGQGARLAVDGADVLPNVFYLTIPGRHNGPLFWIQYVVAILATLIASQAMITATFSLVQQLLNMKCLPSYELFLAWDLAQLTPAFQATHGAYVGQNSGSSIYTDRKLDS